MKKRLLSLLSFAVTATIIANNDSGELAVALAQSAAQIYVAADNAHQSQPTQSNYLKRLSWLYKNNPHFYKLHSFKEDLPYYLAAVPEKIKELEAKITAKKSGLTSRAMARGSVTTVISALCGYAAYFIYQQRKSNNMSTKYPMVSQVLSQEYMYGCVGMSLLTALFAVATADNFYKVVRYAERLAERLERYKKILVLLEKEKELNGEYTIDAAAIKLMKVVVEAINVAVDQAIVTADKAATAVAGAPETDTVALTTASA